MNVDPTDAMDVVVICSPPASSGYAVLRSLDGGATWARPRLGVSVNCVTQMGWAGATLLLAFELCDSGSCQTRLIASAQKGPFKRLDTAGKVSGITRSQQRSLITGHGPTYYVRMGAIGYNPPQLDATVLVSEDSGATWTTATLNDGGQRVHLLAVGHTGPYWTILDGIGWQYTSNAPSQLALSTNDGQSWSKYPRPWPDEVGPNDTFIAPDGTVLATDVRAAFVEIPNAVYMAAPGATQWDQATAVSGSDEVFLPPWRVMRAAIPRRCGHCSLSIQTIAAGA
ncbi:MAG TPA: hypothetical protein VGP82_17940 [Ktedonobacterales bacterium]|nr:hypothetical protein [Ktedonobacterales bacterium]